MTKDLFISYSSKDEAIVKEVLQEFTEQNISYWFAPSELEGAKHDEEIVPAIKNSKIFLIFLSQYSRPRLNMKASQWVRAELLTAIDYKKCILPIKLDQSVDEETENLAFKSLPNYIDFTAFEHSMALVRISSIVQNLLLDDNYKKKEIDTQRAKDNFIEKLFKSVEEDIKFKRLSFAQKTLEKNKILASKNSIHRKILLESIIQMSKQPIKDMPRALIVELVEKLHYLRNSPYKSESYFLEAMIAQSYFAYNGLYDDLTIGFDGILKQYKQEGKANPKIFLLSKHIKNVDKGFMSKWM